MKKLFFLAVLVAPLAVGQVHRTVSLTPPTERMDGTQLFEHEIDRYDIECLRPDSELVTAFTIRPPETAGATPPVFEPGTYFCRARTVDTLGQVSPDWAESGLFTVGHPCQESPSPETCEAPMPPQPVIVSLD